jgi:serine protease inhibitor
MSNPITNSRPLSTVSNRAFELQPPSRDINSRMFDRNSLTGANTKLNLDQSQLHKQQLSSINDPFDTAHYDNTPKPQSQNNSTSNILISNSNFNAIQLYSSISNTPGQFIGVKSIQNILSALWLSSTADKDSNVNLTLDLLATYLRIPKTINKAQFYNLHLQNNTKSTMCKSTKDILLINDEYPINEKFVIHLAPLVTCVMVNKANIVQECKRINKMITQLYPTHSTTNVVKPILLNNLDLTAVTCGVFRTVWRIPFQVQTSNNNNTFMLCSEGKLYPYYEDSDVQLIEFPLADDIHSVGIILSKNSSNIFQSFTMKNFLVYQSHLTPTIIDRVVIPKFVKQNKLRVNSILQQPQVGLDELFINLSITQLLGAPAVVTDIIQNILVVFDETSKPDRNATNQGISTNKSFVVGNPGSGEEFIYYWKNILTGELVLIGNHCM